jgi:hypothetical protein
MFVLPHLTWLLLLSFVLLVAAERVRRPNAPAPAGEGEIA